MEKEISNIYKKSTKGVSKKWTAFMKESEADLSPFQEAYDKAVKSGDKELIRTTGKALSDAKKKVTLQNNAYQEMLGYTTKELSKVNQTALSYINGEIPSIYAKNYAQIGIDLKSIEPIYKGIHGGESIRILINEDVIKRRIIDGTIDTPFMHTEKFFNIPKDIRWNTKQINSSVLQGILQGESMDKIAQRIYPVVNRNASASIRNARTLVTGAENQGRQDSYERLEEEGVVMKKVWISTGDDKTRESHLVMDGQEVNVDDDFIDGDNNHLSYPADPSAPAETVYGCRCSMRIHVIGFRREDGSVSKIDFERNESHHEKEILAEKERRK